MSEDIGDPMERLILAVEKVQAYLTRLSTYSHIYALGNGIANAVSSVVGAMSVVYFDGGNAGVVAASGATGSLTVSKPLEGSVAAQSNVADNEMDISNQLEGSVAAQSNVADVADLDSTTPILFLAGVSSSVTITGGAHLDIN